MYILGKFGLFVASLNLTARVIYDCSLREAKSREDSVRFIFYTFQADFADIIIKYGEYNPVS